MFEVIVAATDGSGHGTKAVGMAARLAAIHGARLVIVHVQGQGEVPAPLRRMAEVEHLVEPEHLRASQVANLSAGLSLAERGETAAHRERVHHAIAERVVSDAVSTARKLGAKSVEGVVEYGSPADRVVARADSEKADLVVLGSRGLSEIKGLLLGSVSHRICQQAGCACLTVK